MPITRQIVDQIRAGCISGTLAAGFQLPSVRELARQLTVNQNTVLRAYEKLSAEGLIERRHGEGTFVTAAARGTDLRQRRSQLLEELAALLRRAIQLGISDLRLLHLVEQVLAESPSATREEITK